MATQTICYFNKYGFCKYLEKCRKHHDNIICEKSQSEIRECHQRHPRECKYFRDLGFCKFSEWCRFSHNVGKNNSVKNEQIEKLEDKIVCIKSELEMEYKKVLDVKNEEIRKLEDRIESVESELKKKKQIKALDLEGEIKDVYLKVTEKDQTLSKMNKKMNVLKEKVTLLFDLENRYETLEKKVEKLEKEPLKDLEINPLQTPNNNCK